MTDASEPSARTAPTVATAGGPDVGHGLVLRPFRAVRPVADGAELAGLLCPPYDVIDETARAELLRRDARNAVSIVLPTGPDAQRYDAAAALLTQRIADGDYRVDEQPALYVYEMRDADGSLTRGLVGAVELRDPADGVILPHENTMAGPVADRLALMSATETDVEPIYLVYDGGGAASALVQAQDEQPACVQCSTPDGVRHRLWAVTDSGLIADVAADLVTRRALIADGHHRYATYRALQQRLRAQRGPGPWDFGLALLVDSTSYGPQVHAIHRYVNGLTVRQALDGAAAAGAHTLSATDPADGLRIAEQIDGFAVVVTDGAHTAVITDPDARLRPRPAHAEGPDALEGLDVTVVHRGLIGTAWGLEDDEQVVGYAHSPEQAVELARTHHGVALLMRPTPVAAVAAVAAAGARMPRKSTLFTPKPASGLLMRRFADA